MKFLKKLFKKKDKKKNAIEIEFEDGKILLPTNIKDFEDYEDFKLKTSNISNIKNELKVLEQTKGREDKLYNGE